MRRGWVRLNGLGLSPLMSSVWWVPGDKKAGRERKRKLLSLRRMNHPSRACSSCGAVVLDPTPPAPP
jgi:hypothetical protein